MRRDVKISMRVVLRYAAAAAIVAVCTLTAEVFYRLTGSNRLSSIFLAGVVLAAFLLGSGPAYLAGSLAFLVYLWQVDPRYQFAFGSPDDFNTLMVFLAVSLMIGLLTGRARDEAAAAKARARVTAALLEATRDFSASSDERFIRERLAERLAEAARGEALVGDGDGVVARPGAAAFSGPDLTAVTADAPLATTKIAGWAARPLRAGGEHLGFAAWRTGAGQATLEEAAVLEVLADTGAAAIARARLSAAKTDAEARARTEDLRNAILSSISHDLRTPLAAIMASATSLHEFGESFDEATRRDLSATIQEETVRLDAFVANLLHMSRLEGGALAIEQAPFSVTEAISRAMVRRARGAGPCVQLKLESGLEEALGDPGLFEQAFGNIFENAVRYAPGKPILVRARRRGERILVEVLDEGPGVPEAELSRIFEKFYRTKGAGGPPGTGLGLAIARGMIEAMGGAVEACNRRDGPGLAVAISLPVAA